MHADVEAQRVREMLAKKLAMNSAWEAYQTARLEYKKAQDSLTGGFPSNQTPGPYICGTTFIKATGAYSRADEEVKFEYSEATRIHTSD